MIATSSQTVGPFFSFGLTTNATLARVAAPDCAGEHITLRVRIVDGDGVPVPDAMVELWQADANGTYGPPTEQFRGFGRLGTDADGSCTFETIRPGSVSDARGAVEAPHVNLCIFMRGLLRHVYTRAYFAGDATRAQDVVLAQVPDERRHTLVARPVAESAGEWLFEVHLQGEHETVFFDL